MKNFGDKVKGILDGLDFDDKITLPNWDETTKNLDQEIEDASNGILCFETFKNKKIQEEIKNNPNIIEIDFKNKKRIS